MAKKKRASKKSRLPKPSRPKALREESSASAPPVNLEKALRDSGVREERIPEALTFLRAFSDEQAGPDRPTTDPMPADPGSPEEARATEAGREFRKERAEWEREAECLAAGKAAVLQAKRYSFWKLETGYVRDRPRPSHVGRALYEKGAVREGNAADYIAVYEHLKNVEPSPLPIQLCEAVNRVRAVPVDPSALLAFGPKNNKAAASMLTKNMDVRRKVLVEQLGYAQQKKTSKGTLTWLTALGRKVFKGWPDWAHDAREGDDEG